MNAEMDVTVKELFKLPPGCVADAITADGHVIAFCEDPDGRPRFLWDGEAAGTPFDGLADDRDGSPSVHVSDDGAHVAYVGFRGDMMFVGRDDHEDPEYLSVIPSVPPTFGGPGLHLAYGAEIREGELRLVVDGTPVGRQALAEIPAIFSSDGGRLAYVETRENDRGQPAFRVILDGHAGEWVLAMSEAAGGMQFSPDGSRFAYYAIDDSGHARWFADGVPRRPLLDDWPIDPTTGEPIGVVDVPVFAAFSPDSRRFAYVAAVENGFAMIEDDVPGPSFRAVGIPVFSRDSLNLAYSAESSGPTTTLVVDGAIAGEWPGTGSGDPIFSSDSRRIALALQREEGRFLNKLRRFTVAVDGHAYPEVLGEDASIDPAFSPDGARIAWWVKLGTDRHLVIDGVLRGDGAYFDSHLRFDALGRLVHASRLGNSRTVTIDGHPGPLADDVAELFPASEVLMHQRWRRAQLPFRLSEDGAHVTWAGVFGHESRPVFDDEVGPSFAWIHDCRFLEGGEAVWWAQTGTTVFLVERARS